MNNLLQLKNKNGKQVLSYHYKRIQDIDDVILQLLNEADMDGFIRSSLDKTAGDVLFDITGYVSLADIGPVHISIGVLRNLLSNLYRLLAYLEDSFIDIEYVMFEEDCILLDPATKKLYLIVLPCQEAMDSEVVLSDCLEKIVNNFTYDQKLDGEYVGRVQAKIKKGIRSLTDLQDIIEMLQAGPDMMPDELFDDWKVSGIQNEEEGTTDVLEELSVPEVSDANVLDDLYVPEVSDTNAEDEVLCPQENTETRVELRDEIRAEVINEVREELRAEMLEEVRRELRAEVIEEVRRELRAEMMAEETTEVLSDMQDSRMPYLIRRKTGEVIQLNKQTFILGKMDNCCDYVISNNNAISRIHAVIKYRENSDDYFIVDCNSTNHIYLNGCQIPAEQPMILENGMHIHLALEEFIFQIRG
ncbi:MAG: FHA domain-containing protein [Coprococcus sp.]